MRGGRVKQELMIGTPVFSILLSLRSLNFYSFPWLRPTGALPPVQERLGLTVKAHFIPSFSVRPILFFSLSIPIFNSLWSPSEVLSLFTFVLTAQDIFKWRSCSVLFDFVSSLSLSLSFNPAQHLNLVHILICSFSLHLKVSTLRRPRR